MISILCITQAQSYSLPFLRDLARLANILDGEFVVALDDQFSVDLLEQIDRFGRVTRLITVKVEGPSIEGVLDEAISYCHGDYILRIDDDERCSPAMITWLKEKSYLSADHWCFPRVHFWGDSQSVLITPSLWPDQQTRLSIKAKAGGRSQLHAGSPFGFGEHAPVVIEHHKFLVKSYAERKIIAERYDQFRPGYGTRRMLPYNLPEDAYRGPIPIRCYGDGAAPGWILDGETRSITLRGANA